MNPLAKELNDLLSEKSPSIYNMLSQFGKEMYFPKGIISQSQEAKTKAHKFNATIGTATEAGHPIYLPSIQKYCPELDPKDVYPYAPTAGKPELRKAWQKKLFQDNPSLNGKEISSPIVTVGLTHGLSLVCDLFLNHGESFILPDKFWGNYNFMMSVRYGGKIVQFPFFKNNKGFNLEAFEKCLAQEGQKSKKLLVILNFPNNPTGYFPLADEAEGIKNIILKQAEKGNEIIVVTDDSYFGLFYEDSYKESLFGILTGLHPNVLAIKLDGATKEEYAWGFRTGFITFGLGDQSVTKEVYPAIEKKVMGAIRNLLSNAPHPSQTLVLKALESPTFQQERDEKFKVMKARAIKMKEVLSNPKYDSAWTYYPFNSGYFMCIMLKTVNAEKLRQHILDKYGVGVISIGDTDIRIAFSCLEVDQIEEMFELIYQGVKDLE